MALPKVNSVINLNVPASAGDLYSEPEVKGLADLVVNAFTNLLSELERYSGFTQKDITLWNSLTPSDTLLKHQLGRLYVVAGENLAFGDFVNCYNDAGTLKVRKANGAAGLVKPARGFCSTAAGILTGNKGEVILSQGLLAIAGLLPGQAIYLSNVPGQAAIAPLVGVGDLEQYIGYGIANNLAYIEIAGGQYIQH